MSMARRVFLLSLLILTASRPLSAQWMQTSFPSGATASCFMPSGGFVFAGTSGGVYRSSDSGLTWAAASAGLTNNQVTALAATATHLLVSAYGGGVYRSTDNGGSWTPANDGLPDLYVTALTVHGGTLFAGAFSGVYQSTDNGASWDSAGLDVRVSQFAAIGSCLFAGTYGWGVYRFDNGAQWTSVHGGQIISALVAVGTDLFAVDQFVHRSSDLGATWTSQSSGIAQNDLRSLAAGGSTLFAAGPGDGVYSSTDRGDTWEYAGDGLTDRYVYALGSTGAALFAGTPGKIWMLPLTLSPLDIPYSWAQVGLGGESVNCLAQLPNGCIVAGTQSGMTYTSTDNGLSWIPGNAVLDATGVLALATDSTGSVFAGTQGGGVYHSTDNGVTWHQNNSGLTITSVHSIKVGPGSVVYAAGGDFQPPEAWGAVFRSDDHGEHWTKMGDGVYGTALLAMGISPKTATMIVSSGSGRYYRSTNGGTVWSELELPEGWAGMCIEAMANGWFFAGSTGGGVYRSTDDGATWTLTHAGTVQALCFNTRGYVFEGLANSEGVAVSVDSGGTYTPIIVGLTHRWVHALLSLPTGHILAGTEFGGGVYRTMRSTTSIRQRLGSPGQRLALEQNYPNPFNPTTTIRYNLPHRAHISLAVFNTLGQKVAELVNDDLGGGYHEVEFNAGNLASGVYFYRLQAGSFVEVKRLVLMR